MLNKRVMSSWRLKNWRKQYDNIEPKKLTPDDLLREALKDDPITEMAKLMTQRYNIEQSIKKLLPKMTKDEVTEVYHTLYRIAQKVNEREGSE